LFAEGGVIMVKVVPGERGGGRSEVVRTKNKKSAKGPDL
jgi:hypothetical protein